MLNRAINIKDKNSIMISESDLLVIDVTSLSATSSFFRSNMGEVCTRDKVERVEIQLVNTYPLLKLHYEIKFLPTSRIETCHDESFLKHLAAYGENITKKECTVLDLTAAQELDFTYPSGQVVKTKDEFFIPKEKIQYNLFMKEGFVTQEMMDSIHSLKIIVTNVNFRVRTSCTYLNKDGLGLSTRVMMKCTDESYNLCNPEDKAFWDAVNVNGSMPWGNHGEEMLTSFLKMM